MLTVAPSYAIERRLPGSGEEVMISYAPLVKNVAPAVVNIYTKRRIQESVSPLYHDPVFRQFFGQDFPAGALRERVVASLGSGVIVRQDGVILTNLHVIKESDEIRVVLADKREFDAKLALTDAKTDLALLKIQSGGEVFPYLTPGDSDSLEVGDLVLAIGNPFGVGQSVTSGIVSALARTKVGISDFQFFIQTDAAINPGNSGGALVDMQGQLVGINTAIFSKTGGSIGIGFATPANMAKVILSNYTGRGGEGVAGQRGKSESRILRPWLGVTAQPVTAEIARSMGLTRPGGVLISKIYVGSSAEQAGLKTGDIITHIDGKEIQDEQALRYRIATIPLNGTALFTILRGGAPYNVTAMMVPAPETPPRNERRLSGKHPLEGAVAANLSPALADEMDVDTLEGVAIIKVEPNSTADQLGFARGDILLTLNGSKIENTQSFERDVQSPPRGWNMAVKRGGQTLAIKIGR